MKQGSGRGRLSGGVRRGPDGVSVPRVRQASAWAAAGRGGRGPRLGRSATRLALGSWGRRPCPAGQPAGGGVFLTSPSPGRRLGVPAPLPFLTGCAPRRAEPALSRIREDRRRIVLPAIDNIKYDTFEVQQYASAAHGYNWGLWCMYIIPPQDWLDRGDEAAPIR